MHYNNAYANIVRDFNKSQGTTHVTDLAYQILRDYHIRNVSIQNSALDYVTVGVTTYVTGPQPRITFTLCPGETKELGINSQGGPVQFLWLMNPSTLQLLGEPVPLNRNANEFVIRGGLNKWFVQFFKHPSYYAAK